MSAQGGRGSYMMNVPVDNSWAQLAATSTTAQASMFNNALNGAYGLADTGIRARAGLMDTGLSKEWDYRTGIAGIPASLAATKYSSDQQLEAAKEQAKAQKSGGMMSGLGSLAAGAAMLAF